LLARQNKLTEGGRLTERTQRQSKQQEFESTAINTTNRSYVTAKEENLRHKPCSATILRARPLHRRKQRGQRSASSGVDLWFPDFRCSIVVLLFIGSLIFFVGCVRSGSHPYSVAGIFPGRFQEDRFWFCVVGLSYSSFQP